MHNILIVDDEINILNSLIRSLEEETYEIIIAVGPLEALRIFADFNEQISLIISDFKMPDMNGVELLKRVKEVSPETIRIMLTGYADVDAVIGAINRGEVYRFITKPWNDEDLKLTIKNSLSYYDLQIQNIQLNELIYKQNEQLKEMNKYLEDKVQERTFEIEQKNVELKALYESLDKNFLESIKMFMGLIEIKDPSHKARDYRVAFLSKNIAEKLNLDPYEIRDIEIAALLHNIGELCLADSILKKNPLQYTSDDIIKIQQHPVIGEKIVSIVENLRNVGTIIRHHHERFDGKGYPDKLQGVNIPVGSRIIAVADLYDYLINNKKEPQSSAINLMFSKYSSYLDTAILQVFSDFITDLRKKQNNELKLHPRNLKTGMILARDLFTDNGLFLLSKNETLTSSLINKIIHYYNMNLIEETVYVFQPHQ